MAESANAIAFKQSQATASEAERCLLAAFAYFGIPISLIDLGCGPGHLVKLAAKLGVDASGCDIEAEPYYTAHGGSGGSARITRADLAAPIYGPVAGMVLCLEVAEHISARHADTLCDNIVSAVAPGGNLFFSAAVPGQGGSGHINEQPFRYWLNKLRRRGLVYLEEPTEKLSDVWAWVAPNAWWYGRNLLVFRRPDHA